MPWLARTQLPTADGSDGRTYWFRPDATALKDFRRIVPPAGIYSIDARPSWATYGDRLLETGGATENMVITGDYRYWKQGIRAPKVKPSISASGTGWTGNGIIYYALFDQDSDERSALGDPSDELVLANQSVSCNNIANVADPYGRATHIEAWFSIDGSIPRLAAQREIGFSGSVVIPGSLDQLGESFAEEFSLFPRCRYNVSWHDRQVMAGDDENPNIVYISLIGLPERRAFFSLPTKSRQKITGLFVVNDQLIVGCQFCQERMHGYTEDDLGIEIAQPNIGLVSHHSVQVIHGYAWFLSQLGWYVTDGSAWFFIAKDIDTKFLSEYAENRSNYESTWSVYDPTTRVYIMNAGANHQDFLEGGEMVRWVADYTPVLPQTGGGMSQPNWSYDTTIRNYQCGALLAIPGARRQDVFFGGQDGTIYKQDATERSDAGDDNLRTLRVIHATEYFEDCGGDPAHGKEITEIDVFIRSEFNDWEVAVHAGDAQPYPEEPPSYDSGQIPQSFLTVQPPDSPYTYTMQPQWTHRFPTTTLVGQGFQVEIVATQPDADFEYAGYAMEWKDGVYDRNPVLITQSG